MIMKMGLNTRMRTVCAAAVAVLLLFTGCAGGDSLKAKFQVGSFVSWQSERLPFRTAGTARNFRVGEKGMGTSMSNSRVRTLYELTVEPRAGVDLTESPLRTDAARAGDMSNLIRDGNVLRKRYGWRQVTQLYGQDEEGTRIPDRINGIWSFSDADGSCLVVHAGNVFYEVSTASGSQRAVAVTPGNCKPEDTVSEGFCVGGQLYIVGAGDFYVYGKAEGYTGRRLRQVSECAYIPTTTTDILDSKATGTSHQASLDAPNLLTPIRRNTMIGRAMADGDEGVLTFRLDSSPDADGDIRVEIETVNESGTVVTYRLKAAPGNVTVFPNGWKIGSRLLIPEDSIFIRNTTAKDLVKLSDGTTWPADAANLGSVNWVADKAYIRLTGAGLTVDAAEGALNRIESVESPVADTDNITVTFPVTVSGGTDVTGAGFGILFGEDGHTDRLFLGGIPGRANRILYSAPGDPTYFPDVNFFDVGSDAVAVTAFSRVSDGVLAAHKAESMQEPTIYYLTGAGSADSDTLTYTAVFSAVPGGREPAVMSRRACAGLYGDPLVLTRDGVYAVQLRENLSFAERQLAERSRSVRTYLRGLTDSELQETLAVVWRDLYLLALPGGRVLAADSTAVYTDDAGGRQYEWYIWDGIPATAFGVYGGQLLFGTVDGRICRLMQSGEEIGVGSLYADRTATDFTVEDLTLNLQTGRFCYGPALADIRDGDSIRFDVGLYRLMVASDTYTADSETGRIRLTDPDSIAEWNEGMEVMVDTPGSSGLVQGEMYTVSDIDRAEGSFLLLTADGSTAQPANAQARLILPLEDRELTVAYMDAESASFAVKLYANDTEAIPVTEVHGGSAVTSELAGCVMRDTPVAAYWQSGLFDLSTDRCAKTLRRLTVTAEPGACGRVRVGYDVREGRDMLDTPGTQGVSPAGMCFADFAFHNFAVSYTRVLCRRNVNFLRMTFRSENAEPCCIVRITVCYTVTGFRRGGF